MRSSIINVSIGYGRDHPLDFTLSHRIYAANYGYEYRKTRDNLVPKALPTWSKYPAALEVIRDREAVMIVDTDAEILGDCPPFHHVLETNPEADVFMALGHSLRPNAGMIILRGGERGAAFCEALMAIRHQELPEEDFCVAGGDNGHVINLVRGEWRNRLHLLSLIWNNTTKPCDWDCIRHYTGPMRDWLLRQRQFVA